MFALGMWAVAVSSVAGCGDDGRRSEGAPAPTTDGVVDPGVVAAGVTTPPAYDPQGPYHRDPDVEAPRPPSRAGNKDRRPVQLLLRSTPGGALAAVDGVTLGRTPVLWEGDGAGAAHDFTFRLAGHALAHYRFVPITSGIVHGTLARVLDDEHLPDPPRPLPPPGRPSARPVPPPAPAADTPVAPESTSPSDGGPPTSADAATAGTLTPP